MSISKGLSLPDYGFSMGPGARPPLRRLSLFNPQGCCSRSVHRVATQGILEIGIDFVYVI